MKNIFFVINKEKIYAYVVSVLTIVTLFAMSYVLDSDLYVVNETSGNIVNNLVLENNTNIENNTSQ